MNKNEERVRAIYEAIATHNPADMLAQLSPDVLFHIPGTGPIAGDHRGTDSIGTLLQGVMSSTGGTFKMDLIAVLTNEHYAVSLHRWSASRGDESIAMNNFNVWRFGDDGLVAERWEFLEDQQAHDAFWAPMP